MTAELMKLPISGEAAVAAPPVSTLEDTEAVHGPPPPRSLNMWVKSPPFAP